MIAWQEMPFTLKNISRKTMEGIQLLLNPLNMRAKDLFPLIVPLITFKGLILLLSSPILAMTLCQGMEMTVFWRERIRFMHPKGNNIILCDFSSICLEGIRDFPRSEPYVDEAFTSHAKQGSDVYKFGQLMVHLVTTVPIATVGQDHTQRHRVVNLREAVLEEREAKGSMSLIREKLRDTGCGLQEAEIILDLSIRCLGQALEDRPHAYQVADELQSIITGLD